MDDCVDSVIIDYPLGVVLDNELLGLIMYRHDSNESIILNILDSYRHSPTLVLASLLLTGELYSESGGRSHLRHLDKTIPVLT